jgi:hypothetical protein
VVQVDPIKPALKAAGTKRLKLKYDAPVSSFAFNFNLRRYIWGCTPTAAEMCYGDGDVTW